MLIFAVTVGFAAVQLPFIVIQAAFWLDKADKIHADLATSYELQSTHIDVDTNVYRIIRRTKDHPPMAADFMCPCETFYLNLKMLSCDTTSVCVEGIFSTRAFPAIPPPQNPVRDYGRAILQISFNSTSQPAFQILKCLPLDPKEHATETQQPANSPTAPFPDSPCA